ncbi:universal stress protein [Pseudooceanicola sp. 502str34]|uniref:universal stress protein n=1 Tax=Maritimibacter alkaliphilus TaxID=404236 RepID=UPI001C9383B9|nr:universal stress protein [Maritimibacter alkaliphilus]MBY6090492.1 universal stress protein [Maritimibacter alkaliphilus]
MTTETYVVAYEGDDDSTKVLDYAMASASKAGAKLYLVHILEWSPYSFLTPTEIEERTMRRKEELARAKSVIIDPALAKVTAAGLEAEGVIKYGSVVELVAETASTVGASMIFVGRSGSNSISSRVFGSVPLGLAQIAPVPTVIVP